jgi:hypothetical protein
MGRIAAVGVTCAVAGLLVPAGTVGSVHGSSAQTRALFSATLSGQATISWTFTRPAVAVGDCDFLISGDGTRMVTFQTRRATTVAATVTPGGFVFRNVRLAFIAGALARAGSITHAEACPEGATTQIDQCEPTKGSFTGGSVYFSTAQAGVVLFQRLLYGRRHLRKQAGCPYEPAPVRSGDPGIELAPGVISTTTVGGGGIGRIVVRGGFKQTKPYTGADSGDVSVRVQWTMTLKRLRRSA